MEPQSRSEDAAELSDAQLVDGVRHGSVDAYATLWARHAPAAKALARRIAPPREVDDLVSESFLRVLRSLRDGRGPQTAFQAYLLSTLRRVNIDSGRRYHQRVVPTGDDQIETATAPSSEQLALDRSEQRLAWSAWASLPDDSRTLLWRLIVDEQTPAQLAAGLGTTANAVASRAKRARERLRQAFLNEHVAAAPDDDCRLTRSRLGAYARSGLSARDRVAVEDHLERCPRCRTALVTVIDVGQTLRVYVAPLVLAGAIVGAAPGPLEVGLTAGTSTVSTSSAAPWVIGAKAAALPVAAAGTVVAAAVAVILAVLPSPDVGLGAAPYASGSTARVTSAVPSARALGPSAGMPATAMGVAPPPVGTSRSTQSRPLDPASVVALSGEGASARSREGSPAGRSQRLVNASPGSSSRVSDPARRSVPPVQPVVRTTTPAAKTPATKTPATKTPAAKTPATKTPATKPPPVPKTPATRTPATKPPPVPTASRTPTPRRPMPTASPTGPTRPPTPPPTPTPVTGSFVLRPATSTFYRARLEVPAGWAITSVRHLHPGGSYEHVGRARRQVDLLLVPGALTVTVSRVEGPATAGRLEVRFTDLLGRPVDGGGSRSLG